MENEKQFTHPSEIQADSLASLTQALNHVFMEAAFDVLANGHEDVIVIRNGSAEVRHHLNRAQAEQLEAAGWSAGEDRLLENLNNQARQRLADAGLDLTGSIDVRVYYETEAAPT